MMKRKNNEDPASIENVDVRCFALFMFIQLFMHTVKDYTVQHNNYTNTAWPGMKGNGSSSGASAIASPRSKATKINYTSSESSIVMHFIKTNLRLVLKLISSEIHKKEDIKLSKTEVDALRIIINISEPISKICPLFEGNSKVTLNELYQWIGDHLSDLEPQSELNIKNLTY